MKFKSLKLIGLVLSITLSTAYAADLNIGENSEHWREYRAARRATPGLTIVQHIQDLATFSDTDSPAVKARKKDALAYFFAVGGPWGFREATAAEHDILTEAIAAMTRLHCACYPNTNTPTLNLVEVRRSYGLRTEDTATAGHLMRAQATSAYVLWTASIVFMGAAALGELSDDGLRGRSFGDLLAALNSQSFSFRLRIGSSVDGSTTVDLGECVNSSILQHYLQPLQALSPRPTPDLSASVYIRGITQQTVQTIISRVLPNAGVRIAAGDVAALQAFARQAFSAAAQQPPAETLGRRRVAPTPHTVTRTPVRRPIEVRSRNGLSFQRTADGYISTNMLGGTMMAPLININGFELSADWPDEDIISAVQRQFGVVQVLYS